MSSSMRGSSSKWDRANRPRQTSRLSLLQLVLIAGLLLAGSGFVTTRPAQAAGISFAGTDAALSFPVGITFSLQASADSPIVSAQLLYSVATVETENLILADVRPAKTIDVTASTDFQNSWIPPGVDVTYHWRLQTEDGQVGESEPTTVTWTDSRFEWTPYTSGDVTILTYSLSDQFANEVLNTAVQTVDRLKREYDVPAISPVRILIYGSGEDYAGANPPNSVEWSAGASYANWAIILAVLTANDEYQMQRVIPHELSHMVLFQATRNPFSSPPLWLDEGIAVSQQPVGSEGDPQLVANALDSGQLFSLVSLKSNFPYQRDTVRLAYAQSYCTVMYLKATWGDDVIVKIIQGYRQSLSHDDVLRQAIGLSTAELDAQWRSNPSTICGAATAMQARPAA